MNEQDSQETFDFGAGPVPAHRHPNGGGWVADTAFVSETAFVGLEAQISGQARVYDQARVYGGARVYDAARVYDRAWVSGRARVFGRARVYGRAWVFGEARVSGAARVSGGAWVFGEARVSGGAWVFGEARVSSVCSRTPLFLSGLEYPVTICDDLIQVGCQSGTLEEWQTKTPEKCPLLESERERILWMAHAHQQRCRGQK